MRHPLTIDAKAMDASKALIADTANASLYSVIRLRGSSTRSNFAIAIRGSEEL
jgi:hypothetical protein